MIQDIQPKQYHNEYTPRPIQETDVVFVFRGREVLLREAYRMLTEQFRTVEKLICEVEEDEPETGGRFRSAVAKAARMMADRLVGDA